MGLKSILENRVSNHKQGTQEYEVVSWLNIKADEIIIKASHHLNHVSAFSEEYDFHNAIHSEGVLGVIEDLLGEKANDLSSYDLFSLIAVSYLHDCGMAVSDSEMEVIKMAEGQLDGQKMLRTDAIAMIRENIDTIYGKDPRGFNGEIQNWLFVPTDEKTLIYYFVDLLMDYHYYRNGRINQIRTSNDHTRTNNVLRIDYLRMTHHRRIERYVDNLGRTIFKDFLFPGLGPLLANNIAKCCRAHGEDANYVRNMTSVMHYYGNETSNLQFIAMMLRLGDIIYFNNDRAPLVLRASLNFKSDFINLPWHIQFKAIRFVVSKGKVACIAFCQTPKDYYDLWTYVDSVDLELHLFISLSHEWEKDYPKVIISDKVDRKNIRHDSNFTPVHNRKLSLDRNNVLNFVMRSLFLNANEYACLRELYLNSLDACRCQIAKDAAVKRASKGYIEFGLGEEERNGINRKYVYCLDNGKGMTKDIIEKYLLQIGASYYRSSDFFKKQAETGAIFTPTSQFGIGMLYCFMIGDEIEVTTHEEGSIDEIISCVIERNNEYIYYQTPSREDAERLHVSGTIVKVFLDNRYEALLNDDSLNDLGYLLWYHDDSPNDETIKYDLRRWQNNLYQILNSFIVLLPEDIDVRVSFRNNNEYCSIKNKPYPIIREMQGVTDKFLNQSIKFKLHETWYKDFKNDGLDEYLDVRIKRDGLECHLVIEVGAKRTKTKSTSVHGAGMCCVEGMGISHGIMRGNIDSICYQLIKDAECVLNFYGENRPQLSLYREDFLEVNFADVDYVAKKLLLELIGQSIERVSKYIKEKSISCDNYIYDEIWSHRLYEKFAFCNVLFYKCLKESKEKYGIYVPMADQQMTFGELLNNDTIIIGNGFHISSGFVRDIILLRLLESNEVIIDADNNLTATGCSKVDLEVISDIRIDNQYVYLHPLGYESFWNEYDVVTFSGRSIIMLNSRMMNVVDDRIRILNNYFVFSKHLQLHELFDKIYSNLIKFRRAKRKIREEVEIYLDRNYLYNIFCNIDTYHSDVLNKDSIPIALSLYSKGMSILVYNRISVSYLNNDSYIIKMGRCSRQELVNAVPKDFWDESDSGMLFIDNVIIKPERI